MLIERWVGVLIKKNRIEREKDLRNIVAANSAVGSQKMIYQLEEYGC
jgi:hypothetical protein